MGVSEKPEVQNSHTQTTPSKRLRRKWKSEGYAVKREQVERILSSLGVSPKVDAFSNKARRRMVRGWGPESPEGENAFSKNWGSDVLWLNPPFKLYGEVVEKIQKDGAHAVLVVPEWPRQNWYPIVKSLEVKGMRFPEGTELFEMPEGKPKGTNWPVEALYVCG